MPTSRPSILSLLKGEHLSPAPAFSGLSHVLATGLASEGLEFSEVHGDAGKMARAAAATFQLTGLPSAAVPFDLCVEAEALGSTVDFLAGSTFDFPRIPTPPFKTSEVLLEALQTSDVFLRSSRPGSSFEDIRSLARIPIICEAISQLKREIGADAVIGGILAGPFTVLSTLVENTALYGEMKRQPQLITGCLFHLSSFIARVGHAYREAGADFLTVHEMGGSPTLLGAKYFEQFVFPSLKELARSLPPPRVLAVCGNLNEVPALLGAVGADALSIDQSNDLASLRRFLPDALLFGNLDPVGLLSGGVPEEIRFAVRKAVHDGADGVWPGCDLVPATPPENIHALMT